MNIKTQLRIKALEAAVETNTQKYDIILFAARYFDWLCKDLEEGDKEPQIVDYRIWMEPIDLGRPKEPLIIPKSSVNKEAGHWKSNGPNNPHIARLRGDEPQEHELKDPEHEKIVEALVGGRVHILDTARESLD